METEEKQYAPQPELDENGSEKIRAEQPQRERLMRRYVEGRIIALAPDTETEDLSDEFQGLSTAEKSNLLYEKLMARWNTLQEIQQAEKSGETVAQLDPYLIAEIKTLWEDEATADLFCQRFAEARVDAKLFRLSELGSHYQKLNAAIDSKKEEYKELSKALFTNAFSRPDNLSAARGKVRRLARELIHIRDERQKITSLEDLPPIPENTDIAASLHYETLKKYKEQIDQGFCWLPYFENLQADIERQLENSRWPILTGEGGTGKSQLADAATLDLTGKTPTKLPCLESTGEKDIIGTQELDEQGSFMSYGVAMRAISGFSDSQHKVSNPDGPFVRLDEFLRLSSRPFGIFKELKQLRPGEKYHGETVPPDFRLIGTTNPASPRYPACNDIDPALAREFSFIDVDYPPMTSEDPQLYEFMLAAAIDENGHIALPENEVAPSYDTDQTRAGEKLLDGREIVEQLKLNPDQTAREHGTLYRLAFAVRAVQDAFSNHYKVEKPDHLLHYSLNSNNLVQISPSGHEPLTLVETLITLEDVRHWVEDFFHRMEKDTASFHVESFSEWIASKLQNHISIQRNSEDQAKLTALFDHFHLLDGAANLREGKPLTPREIGYLSPRVPRPLHLKHPEPKSEEGETEETVPEPTPETELYSTTELTLEDGSKVLIHEANIPVIDKNTRTVQLYPGSVFNLSADRVCFKGIVDSSDPRPEYHGKPVIETDVASGGGLHRIVELGEIAENGEDFWSLEILTTEEIERQLGDWKAVYEKLDLAGFTLPSKEELMAYLSDNPEFIELLKTKEQQGFTKMVIAPLELKPLIDKLNEQVMTQGGTATYLSETWAGGSSKGGLLTDESKIQYLATMSKDAAGNDAITGGQTMAQMKASPESFGILNGCLVSFVKERQNLLKSGDSDEIDSTGRKEIKGGLTPRAYLETYFSDKDPHYQGEDAMLPQEWLALFADDLYQKYVKDNRAMPTGSPVTDLLDAQTATWFTSTHLPGREILPYAFWSSDYRRLYFHGCRPDDANGYLAPRPSVRKAIKT